MSITEREDSMQDYKSKLVKILIAARPYLNVAHAQSYLMVDHGVNHVKRVEQIAFLLALAHNLDESEMFFLRAASLLHDIGNAVNRDKHNEESQKLVVELAEKGRLPLSPDEAGIVGLLCKWHRKEYDHNYEVTLSSGETIRVGMLASFLRISDAMDMDFRRSPGDDVFIEQIIKRYYPDNVKHHKSVRSVKAIRFKKSDRGIIQVFLDNPQMSSLHIGELCKELAGVPFKWGIEIYPIKTDNMTVTPSPSNGKRAAVISYFTAHGLVTAALSKKNLELEGFEVDVIFSYESTGNVTKFWETFAPSIDVGPYTRIVLCDIAIDSNNPNSARKIFMQWIEERKLVFYIDHHEHSFRNLQGLPGNVLMIITEEITTFYGEFITQSDFMWSKLGALSEKDDNLIGLILSEDEEILLVGLMGYFIKLSENDPDTPELEMALDAIINDNRDFFVQFQQVFSTRLVSPSIIMSVSQDIFREGKVLIVKDALHKQHLKGRSWYWVLEKLINIEGPVSGEELSFRTPYAIAWRPMKDKINVLIQTHVLEALHPPARYILSPGEQSVAVGHEKAVWLMIEEKDLEDFIKVTVAKLNAVFE